MASCLTPDDANGPYTDGCTMLNHARTDSNVSGLQPDLQALLHHWQQTASRMTHERDRAKDDIQALKRKLEISNAKKKRLSRRYRPFRGFDPKIHEFVSRSFVARAQETQNTINSLKKEINEKTNEHDSVVSLWQDALQELDEAKSSKKSLIVDDDAMASKWKQLQFVIKNLSTSFVYGLATSSIDSIAEQSLEQRRRLMLISDGSPTKNEYSYSCQILIWDFITAKIFLAPTIVWGQDVFDSTDKLFAIIRGKSDRNKISASDFHTFRAQTGEIIKTATNVDLTICDNLKAELKAQLRPFAPPENTQDVSCQLHNIIDKAVDLATIFTRSRCDYHVESMDRGSGRPFDANTMDKIDGGGDEDRDGSRTRVYSIISPALLKYGNSKGENYEESIVLAKATVLRQEMTQPCCPKGSAVGPSLQ